PAATAPSASASTPASATSCRPAAPAGASPVSAMDRSLRIRFALMALLFVALFAITVTLSNFYKRTARVKTLVIPPDVTSCENDEDSGLSNQLGSCPPEAAPAHAA